MCAAVTAGSSKRWAGVQMSRALLKNARSAIVVVEPNFSESSQMEGRREVGCERTIWRAERGGGW